MTDKIKSPVTRERTPTHYTRREFTMTDELNKAPPDIPCKSAIEVPYCQWCRWEMSSFRPEDSKCSSPVHAPLGMTYSSIVCYNSEGKCLQYEPSGFTKLVRFAALRKPVKR